MMLIYRPNLVARVPIPPLPPPEALAIIVTDADITISIHNDVLLLTMKKMLMMTRNTLPQQSAPDMSL